MSPLDLVLDFNYAMNKEIGRINIKFGWGWLFVSVLIAMWMGLYAFKHDWLGGYTSLPRRFLRLSHIAFMALSLTNVLYGLCIDFVNLSKRVKKIGSYYMIVAAVSMWNMWNMGQKSLAERFACLTSCHSVK